LNIFAGSRIRGSAKFVWIRVHSLARSRANSPRQRDHHAQADPRTLGCAKLEANFECEAGRSVRDERALDAEDESSPETRAQTSAVLEAVSFVCAKLEFRLVLTRQEIFVARNESDIERVPALLLPRAIIAECGGGE
jgi:hypothetical protein